MMATRYFAAVVALLSVCVHPVLWAARAHQPFLLADIDGDGKKDGFYRIALPGNRVELGVRLTKYNNKYKMIFRSGAENFRSLKFSVYKRQKFIDDIECAEGCTDYRLKTIALLRRSVSPEVVDAYMEESSASAIFLNENGRVVQEWYSD